MANKEVDPIEYAMTSLKESTREGLVQKIENYKLEVQQTQTLTQLAEGVTSIATFLNGGGLMQLVQLKMAGDIMASITGGLAAKDGRNALDARTIKQNSLEVVELIMTMFNKMGERLKDQARDPEIKEPQE